MPNETRASDGRDRICRGSGLIAWVHGCVGTSVVSTFRVNFVHSRLIQSKFNQNHPTTFYMLAVQYAVTHLLDCLTQRLAHRSVLSCRWQEPPYALDRIRWTVLVRTQKPGSVEDHPWPCGRPRGLLPAAGRWRHLLPENLIGTRWRRLVLRDDDGQW